VGLVVFGGFLILGGLWGEIEDAADVEANVEGLAMSSYEGSSELPPFRFVLVARGTHLFNAYAPPQTSHLPPPLGWNRLNSQMKGKMKSMIERNVNHHFDSARERSFDGRM